MEFAFEALRTMMMSRRKRVTLSVETKLEIIRKLRNGVSATNLAQEYVVGKSTITGIKNNERSIMNYLQNIDSLGTSVTRRSLKLAKNNDLDTAVYQWFLQCRDNGIPLTGPMICEKARELNAKIKGGSSFKPSNGWLLKFKSCHGIRQVDTSGEKFSTDRAAAEIFRTNLNKFLQEKGYSLRNVYNAGETGLTWRAIPQETSSREKPPPGRKISNDRVTALVCANATGCHQLPVLVIGNTRNPRCLKNLNMHGLPFAYKAHNQSRLDSAAFAEWFEESFALSIKEYQLKRGCNPCKGLQGVARGYSCCNP